jgi:hypothetical protein
MDYPTFVISAESEDGQNPRVSIHLCDALHILCLNIEALF